ncbi:hypothetical protein PSFL111601_27990 [Pseudomonas floridensis]
MIDHLQATAVEQRPPHLQGAGIECRVGGEGKAVLIVEVGVTIVQHQTHDTAMRNAHAFGCTGGA